jgi:hypothetical protein
MATSHIDRVIVVPGAAYAEHALAAWPRYRKTAVVTAIQMVVEPSSRR